MKPKNIRHRILARLTREIRLDYPPDRVDPARKTPRIRGARQNLIRQFISEAGGSIYSIDLPVELRPVARRMIENGLLIRLPRISPFFRLNPTKKVRFAPNVTRSRQVLQQVRDLGGLVKPKQLPGTEGHLRYLAKLGYLTFTPQIHTRLSLAA